MVHCEANILMIQTVQNDYHSLLDISLIFFFIRSRSHSNIEYLIDYVINTISCIINIMY